MKYLFRLNIKCMPQKSFLLAWEMDTIITSCKPVFGTDFSVKNLSYALNSSDQLHWHISFEKPTTQRLALLDRFDMLAPNYDNLSTVTKIRDSTETAGLNEIEIYHPGY